MDALGTNGKYMTPDKGGNYYEIEGGPFIAVRVDVSRWGGCCG